jgi:hypothetical protein
MAQQQAIVDDLNKAIAILENWSRIDEANKRMMNNMTKKK